MQEPMSTEPEVVAPDDAATQQTGEPEQNPDVARPEDETHEDESTASALSDDQREIRKLRKRIDRLTAGRGAATREAELLRDQLAQLQARPQETEQVSPADVDRLATEKAKVLRQQETMQSRVETVLKSGRKLDGFDRAVNAVADEVPFTDSKGRPTPFVEAVLDSDEPAKLLHWLGNNPEEAAEFAGLSAAQIGRRIARLEDRIAREAKAKTSSAPAPLKPVTPKATPDNPAPKDGNEALAQIRKAQGR